MRQDLSDISLCNSDFERNAYLHRVLDIVLDTLEQSKTFRNATVILTGSLARGEGSVLKDESGYRSLSDMEFLVTLELEQPIFRYASELTQLEAEANQRVAAAGLCCQIEFTFALERFFKTAKPSIFVCELKSHGKVVHGPAVPFELLQGCSPQEIPKIDAFYLLCNRIVEQLDVFERYFRPDSTMSIESINYAILKFYIDMATSLLVFAGDYSTTYSSRRNSFLQFMIADSDLQSKLPVLRQKVNYWTDVKLSPTQTSLTHLSGGSVLSELRELANIVLPLWYWELAELFNNNIRHKEKMNKNLRYWGAPADKCKEVYKYFIRAVRGKSKGAKLSLRYVFGYPRHILYLQAVDIYRGLAADAGQLNEPSRHFSLPMGVSDSITEIVATWKCCFRN